MRLDPFVDVNWRYDLILSVGPSCTDGRLYGQDEATLTRRPTGQVK